MSNSTAILVTAILSDLLLDQPTTVTYDQVEQAMLDAGLDPYDESDVYEDVLAALDQRDIPVVDEPGTALPVNGEDPEAVADEVVAELKRILGPLYQEGKRLLTASEERTLLEIVRDGACAAEELPHAGSERDAIQLWRRTEAGRRAETELVVRNLGLVCKLAYAASHGAGHLKFDDLLQEGTCGLLCAIRKFDLNLNLRLSTYATWWIRQAIARAMAEQDRTISLPAYCLEEVGQLRAICGELRQMVGREPTDLELAVALGLVDPERDADIRQALSGGGIAGTVLENHYRRALRKTRYFRGLAENRLASQDGPAGDDEQSELGGFIPDHPATNLEQIIDQHLLAEELDQCLETLGLREAEILRLRFGLRDGTDHTLDEIGIYFGVTGERIRQIEQQALKRLRDPSCARGLRPFLPG